MCSCIRAGSPRHTDEVADSERRGLVVEEELDGSLADDEDFVDVIVLVWLEAGVG
jgi:hypothetical protein